MRRRIIIIGLLCIVFLVGCASNVGSNKTAEKSEKVKQEEQYYEMVQKAIEGEYSRCEKPMTFKVKNIIFYVTKGTGQYDSNAVYLNFESQNKEGNKIDSYDIFDEKTGFISDTGTGALASKEDAEASESLAATFFSGRYKDVDSSGFYEDDKCKIYLIDLKNYKKMGFKIY